ncbi:MAG TPA: hypothetical protein VMD99_04855 [Terriglobales bacterium]|nr:hypothetical protein [Terriglobales bacterium]
MTSIQMSTIRRFAYAVVLALTTLNFAPTLASGQETARGRFTLAHDVRWGSVEVPAGEYKFSLESNDLVHVVTLNELNHNQKGFFLLVHDVDDTRPTDRSMLVLRTTADGTSYVSAMQLPEFGMTLRFAKPSGRAEKQIARAGTAAAALGQ